MSLCQEPEHQQRGMVREDEIAWQSAPIPRVEDVDLLGLDDTELLIYAQDLQRDMRVIRETLYVTTAMLVRATAQLLRYQRAVYELRDISRRRSTKAQAA